MSNRKDNFTAGVVNHAVNIAAALGLADAVAFLRRWQVPGHVITRVLMDGTHRRTS